VSGTGSGRKGWNAKQDNVALIAKGDAFAGQNRILHSGSDFGPKRPTKRQAFVLLEYPTLALSAHLLTRESTGTLVTCFASTLPLLWPPSYLSCETPTVENFRLILSFLNYLRPELLQDPLFIDDALLHA
jgi:hypothetical protein